MTKERQARRLKKDKVAAQVAFVIWFIELLFMVNDVIVGLAFGAFGSKTVRTMNMTLFLLILPYAYLMNTSANKQRIIDEGWLNVVKNIFGCNCCIFCNRSAETAVHAISAENTHPKANDKNIFIISETVQKLQESSDVSYELPNVPTRGAINRQGQKQSNTCTEHYELQNISSQAQKSSNLKANRPNIPGPSNLANEQKTSRQLIGENLLRCMIMNIDNEDVYMDQFKGLLSLEDYFKTQRAESGVFCNYNSGDELCDNDHIVKSMFFNCIHGKMESGPKHHGITVNAIILQNLGISTSNHADIKPTMIVQKSDRIIKRTELLNNLALYSDDEVSYGKFLELLIDLEESFT